MLILAKTSLKLPDSSKMFVEVGTTVKVEELNRGIIIQSGNDVSVAMAGAYWLWRRILLDQWTLGQALIGMKDTHFANARISRQSKSYQRLMTGAISGQAPIRDVPDEYRIYQRKIHLQRYHPVQPWTVCYGIRAWTLMGNKTGHRERRLQPSKLSNRR